MTTIGGSDLRPDSQKPHEPVVIEMPEPSREHVRDILENRQAFLAEVLDKEEFKWKLGSSSNCSVTAMTL
ncbi:MAG: hypothetical protein KDD55_12015, partial [Bdellovibrionales bacterium]|nr:hypothetical protein [Bdellovibrionales bacterium]